MMYIPNAITTLRIVLSIALLFINPLSILFLIVYITCCLSDILDGYIARKMCITSQLGSRLDSVADMIFITIMFIILLPIIKLPTYILIWILVIVFVRMTTIVIAFYKYNKFVIGLHTYANKATGFLLLCCPILLEIVPINILGGIVCIAASLSAIEEMLIQLSSKELNTDVIGIFSK
ncbi:MAG: CDP-alcohol phosphatidyltransferase family protein [Bacillaceae bacterium]